MAARDDQQVVTAQLRCIECGQPWRDSAERWRVYLTSDEPREALVYCPACAAREFD